MERFVENEICVLEAGVDVTVRPLDSGFARGQGAIFCAGEIVRSPLHRLQLSGDKSIAFAPRVRSVRTQARQRIDDERQRLQIERDSLDGCCRGCFVDCRNGEDRLALVDRFIRQCRLGWKRCGCFGCGISRRSRQVIGSQDAPHARHRQGVASVDAAHAAVRHRAQDQLAERHAVGPIVFGVLRATRHLGDQIWRRVVVTEQLVIRHQLPPLPSVFSCRSRRSRHRRWDPRRGVYAT